MGTIVPYFLFALERFDRKVESVRSSAGVIIAMENPVYIGRLSLGSVDVEDKSDLILTGRMTADLWRDLQAIGEYPGREVTRDVEELWTLFTDPQMTDSATKVAFRGDVVIRASYAARIGMSASCGSLWLTSRANSPPSGFSAAPSRSRCTAAAQRGERILVGSIGTRVKPNSLQARQ